MPTTCGWPTSTAGNVRRLTSDVGIESSPFFSPDGKLLAFSSHYDGNTDGIRCRSRAAADALTWHPDADIVRGFTPDGGGALFLAAECVHHALQQLFTVPLDGRHAHAVAAAARVRGGLLARRQQLVYAPLADRSRSGSIIAAGRTAHLDLRF